MRRLAVRAPSAKVDCLRNITLHGNVSPQPSDWPLGASHVKMAARERSTRRLPDEYSMDPTSIKNYSRLRNIGNSRRGTVRARSARTEGLIYEISSTLVYAHPK